MEAVRSAEVTHAHAEGILGAVAVAVAAAEVGWARLVGHQPEPLKLLDAFAAYLVPSQLLAGVEWARRLIGVSVPEAAYELGLGAQALDQDTVPFALWLAASYVDDYQSAVLGAIAAGGDMDTVAAIVGGIVATHTGRVGIPPDWLEHREPLPAHAHTAGSSDQAGRARSGCALPR